MVDVGVGLGKGEGLYKGGAEVVVRGEGLLGLAPFKEKYVRVEVSGASCAGP